MVSLQHTLEVGDVHTLNELILTHQERFSEVPQYANLTKPKHHFLTHLVVDVFRYGPVRGFWCMSFEAFNAVVKRAAIRCNFKDVDTSVVKFLSMKCAMALTRKRAMCWLSDMDDSIGAAIESEISALG